MSRRVLLGFARSCACLATLAALGACGTLISSFQPRVGGRGTTQPTTDAFGTGRTVSGRDTTLLGRPRDRVRPTPNGGGELAQRRLCRASGVPSGWIAVAYEASTDQCPGRGVRGTDSVATVAVIVRYATAPLGTRLDVCVDQSTPFGWTWVSDEGPGDPGACPQAAPRGQETVRRIERTF